MDRISKFRRKGYFSKERKVNTVEDIFEYFKDIDLSKIKWNEKGKPVLNPALVKFLLGNEKVNNDCVFRLVLNNLDFGLGYTLASTINHFPVISDMIEKSNGKMNIHSLLDIIDINKVLLYDLEMDEQDITLSTIAKIQNSRQHCTLDSREIIHRIKRLHHERKKKISATIPVIKGKSSNGMLYEVLRFDDERVLTVGIDTGSCFKVGAPGEDFLRYCALDKNGAVLTVTTIDNKYYACPIIRNGNCIYGNGIDPKPRNDEETQAIVQTIGECFNRMSNESDVKETIEIGVLTDLHNPTFLRINLTLRFSLQNHL